jgi:Flagellar basal body rod FlgEFG protein C-terminal
VDLSSQFVELIRAQQAFQANARVITTGDELLTEVVNIKRESLPVLRPKIALPHTQGGF